MTVCWRHLVHFTDVLRYLLLPLDRPLDVRLLVLWSARVGHTHTHTAGRLHQLTELALVEKSTLETILSRDRSLLDK